MSRTRKLKNAIAAAVLLAAGTAQAAVQAVDYASLQGSRVDFQSLSVSDPLGSLIDGVLTMGGVQFGERFEGQWLSLAKAPRPGEPLAQDWFDDLGFGAPVAGLNLLAGAAGANLGAYDYGDADGIALAGIGPQNPDGSDPFGSGAISARFASGQSALGFQLREADGGAGWLALYRADGSLIESVALGSLGNGYYAYARQGGQADIAGFSLYHRDSYYGVAIDNLVYGSVTAVPEPASAVLLLAGLLAVGAAARRRRQC
jgi:hypothetical protein